MSYDFDGTDHSPPQAADPSYVPRPDDLEVIVTLLDIAAIYLTPEPHAEFTFQELLAQANEIGDLTLDERDVRIVLPFMKSLKKIRNDLYRLN